MPAMATCRMSQTVTALAGPHHEAKIRKGVAYDEKGVYTGSSDPAFGRRACK